ncbi:MAG: formylglycine-generating enzyme family protein, partial [Acidobacteriota bacterium]
IGNVWEWTSSKAVYYPGSSQTTTSDMQKQVVMRGGSYQSKAAGDKAITATWRNWVSPTDKHPTIGFRLVREAP